jgi:hypothetical protein
MIDPTDPQEMWDAGYRRGYSQAIKDAAQIIEDYATERRTDRSTDELTRTLWIASDKIRNSLP